MKFSCPRAISPRPLSGCTHTHIRCASSGCLFFHLPQRIVSRREKKESERGAIKRNHICWALGRERLVAKSRLSQTREISGVKKKRERVCKYEIQRRRGAITSSCSSAELLMAQLALADPRCLGPISMCAHVLCAFDTANTFFAFFPADLKMWTLLW